MKVAFSIAALIAAVSAQPYNVTSKPFQLLARGNFSGPIRVCDLPAYNERRYQVLCVWPDALSEKPDGGNTFNLNSTTGAEAPSNRTDLGTPGILHWWHSGTNSYPYHETLSFLDGQFEGFGREDSTPFMRPDSDRGPSWTASLIAFNKQDELVVLNYPETKRWFYCPQNLRRGFRDLLLVYGIGAGKPENGPCTAIDGIKRVFI
ncbi:hypothetical protein CC86DRAFT_376035 [Ophiobolus disseminans]|uniref:Uncharacterized protein n=1 Tax=Ophiobolus disseminans TaxID=1469910 RepID=A0A6A6ZCN1_9PLEO|nr:hypothetical protein CC86DRAFT_376035 [Ophiobolus disseminans]